LAALALSVIAPTPPRIGVAVTLLLALSWRGDVDDAGDSAPSIRVRIPSSAVALPQWAVAVVGEPKASVPAAFAPSPIAA
jgi:hypothetical protein